MGQVTVPPLGGGGDGHGGGLDTGGGEGTLSTKWHLLQTCMQQTKIFGTAQCPEMETHQVSRLLVLAYKKLVSTVRYSTVHHSTVPAFVGPLLRPRTCLVVDKRAQGSRDVHSPFKHGLLIVLGRQFRACFCNPSVSLTVVTTDSLRRATPVRAPFDGGHVVTCNVLHLLSTEALQTPLQLWTHSLEDGDLTRCPAS